jgi:hypothetical protein
VEVTPRKPGPTNIFVNLIDSITLLPSSLSVSLDFMANPERKPHSIMSLKGKDLDPSSQELVLRYETEIQDDKTLVLELSGPRYCSAPRPMVMSVSRVQVREAGKATQDIDLDTHSHKLHHVHGKLLFAMVWDDEDYRIWLIDYQESSFAESLSKDDGLVNRQP